MRRHSRQQCGPLARIEQPADRVAGVNAIDHLGEELADGDLAHLARVLAHLRRRPDGGFVNGEV